MKKPVNSDVYGPLSLYVVPLVGKTGFELACKQLIINQL